MAVWIVIGLLSIAGGLVINVIWELSRAPIMRLTRRGLSTLSEIREKTATRIKEKPLRLPGKDNVKRD